jgi:short subunit dehydrogenase-like uncharacterized protein
MPDVLLFGATGFAGKLTARALAARKTSFAVCGRRRSDLEAVASETGAEEVHLANVGDVSGLARAARGCRVLLSCVGPFMELGNTAVEAALEAGVHYVDSTGEGDFVARLGDVYNESATRAGLILAPAMGFDEVPADVAATIACDGLTKPKLTITYAVPTTASPGTIRSVLPLLASKGPFVEDGSVRMVATAEQKRWAPMPPPMGPRRSVSSPLAELRLAPLHLDLDSLGTYMTVGALQGAAMPLGMPLMRAAASFKPALALAGRIAALVVPSATRDRSGRWTVLAEASSGSERRNVALSGTDVYGLTAELLASAATAVATGDVTGAGVVAPVQLLGVDRLRREMIEQGVSIDVFSIG